MIRSPEKESAGTNPVTPERRSSLCCGDREHYSMRTVGPRKERDKTITKCRTVSLAP